MSPPTERREPTGCDAIRPSRQPATPWRAEPTTRISGLLCALVRSALTSCSGRSLRGGVAAPERTSECSPQGKSGENGHCHEDPNWPAAQCGPERGKDDQKRCPADLAMNSQRFTHLIYEEASNGRTFLECAPSDDASCQQDCTDHEEYGDHVAQDQYGHPKRQLEDHASRVVRAPPGRREFSGRRPLHATCV